MNDGRTRCPHGHLALRVEDVPTYGAGYRQAFADACRLCDGNPAGVPWREPDDQDDDQDDERIQEALQEAEDRGEWAPW